MAGDVNLFFNDEDDPHTAEIEIMIAGGCFLEDLAIFQELRPHLWFVS